MTENVQTTDQQFAGSALFPEARHVIEPTARDELDRAVTQLKAKKRAWINTSVTDRISLIDELLVNVDRAAPQWVASALAAKGLNSDSPEAGEEWLTGPYITARNLRLLRRSLADISRDGCPRLPRSPKLKHGRVSVRVFPTDLYDAVTFRGYRAEVWMKPHVALDTLAETMALAYHKKDKTSGICLVLGAGNVSCIAPTDALYKLFVENRVVILKMNPVNEYMGSHLEQALRPLIDHGALRIVYGGREVGAYLCQHEDIDEIHITGSDKSHDAIVFGGGREGTDRKRERRPLLDKEITSELGNVSGVIVVPGRWRRSDLKLQAENLASMLVNNAGFNCSTTRMIITHRQWDQRDALLDELRSVLSRVPPRKAYYPGARDRFESFLNTHSDAELFGGAADGRQLPWTLIAGLDPDDRSEMCYSTEAFCSLMGETALRADSIDSFLANAVEFVNETLWGTLNAALIVDPRTRRDARMRSAVDKAIADLRVGTVGVNHWPAVSYAMCSPTWGAYPGHELDDIQSGRGVVHNTYMFSQVEKSVLYGPFRPFPKPPWLVTHRRAHQLGRLLVSFECNPSPLKLPAIFWHALRG